MNVTAEQVLAGQAVYSKRVLSVYDFMVLGLSCRLAWKCPSPRLLEHYNDHISTNHLDVGAGTGYFPAHCQFPTTAPRVALMDLNRTALEFASRRIVHYQPETYVRNILAPIWLDAPRFDSIALNYVLHCLPGTMASKAIVFDHLKALMNPHAVLFGSTLLQGDTPRNALAKKLMDLYNRKGVFCNTHDTLPELEKALSQRFRMVSIKIIGCAALFAARV
ncbi:class I SAM-dependent methyltransferase [Chitinivorax sp. B]|uniref:class I SAM-dependent methyltransferase n=1 Tax=Chitinivorax sp. B TaxID=2502235 RepID=UPI0010F8129A|nr:class I SAM-dependent methyltransferase [Chitinivorax sp. B]